MSISTLRFAALFLCIGTSFAAFAQVGCPPGYYPIGGGNAGWVDCAPMGNAESPPDPGPAWATRWGSIAAGDGAFGVSNGATSKGKAKKQALRQCKAQGGKGCRTFLVFYNQCGALAWGDRGNATYSSPEKALGEERALAACSQHAQNCRIYYSECSYPERIR